MSIFVTQSSIASMEEYTEEIRSIFESKRMTNMGPVYKKLQHQLIDYLGVPELSLFVNGHLALEMGLQTFDFPKGSEVITTPYTFVSTTHAIVRQGLVPVFCDINPCDYTIDVSKIEDLITDQTVAIMPVHVYGNICDVEAIQDIADRHGLKAIYDGAHAFGVKYKDVGVGNFGDMCMYSFHATKVFNTIEGGAIAFKNKQYQMRLHELKNFGIHGEDCVMDVGGNAKLDEFRAAMGICNLRYVDENIAKRRIVAGKYDELLSNIPGIKLMNVSDYITQNYAYYPVYIASQEYGESRDDVYNRLAKNDIHARRYFFPATNDLDCYKGKFEIQKTPVAHDVSLNVLCLPMYADLGLDDVEKICKLILKK
ncbi:MAG: DegT/DnrJ/EryC1/StrS family aminotransferase [Lachnospiraceae bacterium]|nr:DegT/DnrJ/EryC1/StrS family aminotransferase [Lachnospiraceae bacterium]